MANRINCFIAASLAVADGSGKVGEAEFSGAGALKRDIGFLSIRRMLSVSPGGISVLERFKLEICSSTVNGLSLFRAV